MPCRNLLRCIAALAVLEAFAAAGCSPAGFYSWNGKSFSSSAPLTQNTALTAYFTSFGDEEEDVYGIPADLLVGAGFSTNIIQGTFYDPAGRKVAGAQNGENYWANIPYLTWLYPLQFDTPHFRSGFNAFMSIEALVSRL